MIFNIRGTNGSGKTTALKRVLEHSDGTSPLEYAHDNVFSPTKKEPERYLEKPITGQQGHIAGKKVGVLGTYANKCGGCDEFSWKGAHDAICEGIRASAIANDFTLYEGIVVSSVFQRYFDLAERIFSEIGEKTTWVIINPPLETCLQQITARSGTIRTERLVQNVKTKHDVVAHFPRKLEGIYAERPEARDFLDYRTFNDSDWAYKWMIAMIRGEAA